MKSFVHSVSKVPAWVWALLLVFIVLAGALGYFVSEGLKRIAVLEARIASSTALMQESLVEVQAVLVDQLEGESARLSSLQEKLGAFQSEVGAISGSVSTLEKLTKLDGELLQKYSRVFFLNEHFAPEDVVEVPSEFKYSEKRTHTIHSKVYPYLTSMLQAAKNAGVELYVFSAYRPFDEQGALNEHYKVTYGAGTANQFSADQGYSEHQLGTTVDLITTGIGGTLDGFGDTQAYQWLLKNAHRFGFTLSYPEGNQYYVYEPWHWRFVGVELATDLYANNKHFYDLEQREIDQYLASIFD